MPEAARLNDTIAHSSAMTGLLLGAAGGLAIGALAVLGGAATVLTGGLAAPLVVAAVGAAIVVGSTAGTASLGMQAGSLIESTSGTIVTGSPTVVIESSKAARAEGDASNCNGPPLTFPHGLKFLATGSATVIIEGFPAARLGDMVECGAKISSGAATVIIGGGTVQTREIASEVPPWVDPLLNWAMIGSAVVLFPFMPGAILGGFVGSQVLGEAGHWLGGALFGEGSKGQSWMTLGGGFLGGLVGGAVGHRVVGNPMRIRDQVPSGKARLTGEPVDVITGRVVVDDLDWELPGPIPIKFKRNYSSSLSWRRSVVGRGWSHSLDMAVWEEPGQIVYRAEDGREIEFDVRRFSGQRMPLGHEVYDPVNRLTLRRLGELRWEVESADGHVHEMHWVGGPATPRLHRVVRTRDRVGHRIEYQYDSRGRLTFLIDTSKRRLRFEHDEQDRLVSTWLPHPTQAGLVSCSRYVYSEAGDLIEVLDALNQATRFGYTTHLLIKRTDRIGLSFHYEYDGVGPDAWCLRTWGDGGIHDHQLTYNKEQGITVVTNSLRHSTVFHSDGRGVVVREVDALGGEKRHEYDEALRLTLETDEMGHTTRYAYDQRDNLSRVVGPDGATVTVVYNQLNLPLEAVDSNGSAWRWHYDEVGQLLTETNPLQETRCYEYKGGLCVADIARGGARTEYTYDEHHNLTRIRLPTDALLHLEYDKRGRQVTWRDALGGRGRARYDLLGRLIRVERPGREVWEGSYDAEGNLLEERREQQKVGLGYDGLHWLAHREEGGTRLHWRHDTEGQIVEVTNEAGERYRFVRDALGRVVREEGFDGAMWHYQYDAAGRLKKIIQPSGKSQRIAHDKAGRLTRLDYDDGTFRAFGYSADGALVEAETESSRLLLNRDALGRVVTETQANGMVTSRYSPAGHRVTVESDMGAHQEWLRDALGSVTGVTSRSPGRSNWVVRMERDAEGLEVSRWVPGGLMTNWAHDEAGRLIEQRTLGGGRTVAQRIWRWRPAGQLAAMSNSEYSPPTEYVHDDRGRLVGERRPDGQLRHRAMDTVSNLYRHPKLKDRCYGPGGRLLEADGTCYTYDADGNLTEKHTPQGIWRYSWNGAGLLSEVQKPDGSRVHLAYDALARRTQKVVWGPAEQGTSTPVREVRFVWNGDVPLHEVDVSAGVTTWLFEPESFSPLGKEDATGRYSVVTDHLGSPTEMYDELGQLAWRMQLDSFGVGIADVAIQHCPWRWPGQYEDDETGLLYNRFRYYDAYAGRYISQDPLRLAAGLNLYGYPEDPLSAIDPLGLQDCSVTGGKSTKETPTVRIRHYTSSKGLEGIKNSRVIKAVDQNKVFAEAAKGKPLSPRDAEATYGIKRGHGRNIVETDVDASRVNSVYNPLTKAQELTIKGDVELLNEKFIKR